MDFEFVRHEPLYDRVLLVLTLDRQKMKERILIGEELQIRFRLQGYDDTEVLCDVTRPLGTMLSAFEHDSDGEWNRFGLIPLRGALYSNRWKQPELEQVSGDFLAKKYLTGDPVRMYVALLIWNEYLKAREPRDRESACERFIEKMNGFTALFMGNPPLDFDEDTGCSSRAISLWNWLNKKTDISAVNHFRPNNFFYPITNAVHCPDPCHLVTSFQFLCDSFGFFHLSKDTL